MTGPHQEKSIEQVAPSVAVKALLFFLVSYLSASLHGAAQDRDDAWVRKRVAEIKESDTGEWRKIAWAESLLAAEKSAKDEGRPIFLFTMDGNLDTGRC